MGTMRTAAWRGAAQPRWAARGGHRAVSAHDPMARRIEDGSLAERVTAELRRAIISGSLAPGQEFSLREIAGMLGSASSRPRGRPGARERRPRHHAARAQRSGHATERRGPRRGLPAAPRRRARDRRACLPTALRRRARRLGGARPRLRRRAPGHRRDLRGPPRVPPAASRSGRHRVGRAHPEHSVAGHRAVHPHRLRQARPPARASSTGRAGCSRRPSSTKPAPGGCAASVAAGTCGAPFTWTTSRRPTSRH